MKNASRFQQHVRRQAVSVGSILPGRSMGAPPGSGVSVGGPGLSVLAPLQRAPYAPIGVPLGPSREVSGPGTLRSPLAPTGAFTWRDPNWPHDFYAMVPTGEVDLHTGKTIYRNTGLITAPITEAGLDPTVCLYGKLISPRVVGQAPAWGVRIFHKASWIASDTHCPTGGWLSEGDPMLIGSNSGAATLFWPAIRTLTGRYTFTDDGHAVYMGP